MPIEIKELHIKAIVNGNNKLPNQQQFNQDDIARIKKEIIREVTNNVFDIIQRRKEP